MNLWIAEVVGLMHLHRISSKALAEHLGITPQYISEILNGKRSPKGVEHRIRTAITEMIEEKG